MSRDPRQPVAPWWEDPTWQTTPWTCLRCGYVSPGTPPIGTPCPVCGYRERGD